MSPLMTQVPAGDLDVDKLLTQLTVDEKVALLAGKLTLYTQRLGCNVN